MLQLIFQLAPPVSFGFYLYRNFINKIISSTARQFRYYKFKG